MKTRRTIASIVIMVIAGIVGFFVCAVVNGGINGAILFSMIAGVACIVYTIDNRRD